MRPFQDLLRGGAPATAVDLAEAAASTPAGASGRPALYVNMIATVDGRAAVGGATRPLGGEADLELLLELRASADAVLIGTGTVRAEGYARLVRRAARRERRIAAGRAEDPLAVLVSRSGDVPWDAGLFADRAQPALVYAAADRSAAPPHVELAAPRALPAVLEDLRARGVRRLLCEGGPGLHRALLAAGLVDVLCLTIYPTITGDDREPTIVAGGALPELARLRLAGVARHGDELFLRYAR